MSSIRFVSVVLIWGGCFICIYGEDAEYVYMAIYGEDGEYVNMGRILNVYVWGGCYEVLVRCRRWLSRRQRRRERGG